MVTGYWVAGENTTSNETFEVRHPHDGQVIGTACYTTDADIERAAAAADACRADFAALPAHARAAALDHVGTRLTERSEEIAQLITAENGKPIFWSRTEVSRAASTFRWAAEETRRFTGELQRLDTDPGATGRMALIRRVPRGPVLGIAPFNFPLNLAVHKVAPALAAGVPIVLKPAPKTPLAVLRLGEILAETNLPMGSWSIVTASNDQAAGLVADPRLPLVSFTGSESVGVNIQRAVPDKHVTLELGGNAAAVVCADWADLDHAVERLAMFAMYQAGQSCISVQRVYVHRDLYDEVQSKLVKAVQALGTGDPYDEATRVGPMVDEAAAQRVEQWVDEAVTAGATALTGGVREGASYAPTVLAGVPEDAKLSCEEVFGPVVTIAPVGSVDEAFTAINASRFGLQAGIFTSDLQVAFRASAELEVGGVIIGDVPSFRADQMPYGGVKNSGVGREGVRSAMTDFTEERVTVLTGVTV